MARQPRALRARAKQRPRIRAAAHPRCKRLRRSAPLLPARPRVLRACIHARAPLHCRTADCAHAVHCAPFCCCRILLRMFSTGILFSVELDLLLLVDILLKLKSRSDASCRCVVL